MPSSAAARTARSRRSTIIGARPSESSSTRSTRQLAGEAASQREHLLLAARQQADAAFEMRLELGEQRQRAIEVAAADAQVLARREVHQHGSLLRHHSEPLPRAHVQRRVGARAEQPNVAAERAQLARERRDRRGLAGAVRPEQRDHLARVDVEVEVAHDLDLPVPGGEAVGLEARAHAAGPRGAAGCRLVAASRAEVRLDDARVVADRVGRALRDRVPEVERDDAVAGLQDQRHVVLDDEHADPAPSRPVHGSCGRARSIRWCRGPRRARRAGARPVRSRARGRCRRDARRRATTTTAARRAHRRAAAPRRPRARARSVPGARAGTDR